MTAAPLSLPDTSTEGEALAWIAERCDGQLARARRLVDDLKANPPAEALATLQAFNDASTAIANAASAASLFSEVHPLPEVRERAEQGMQAVQKLDTDLGLDRELYEIFAGLSAEGLDETATRMLEHTLRDFRRAGVDRDEATRDRLRALAEEELTVGQTFSRNIREGVRSIRVRPDELTGMPQDWLDAHPVDDESLVTLTTDYPDLVPVKTFCSNSNVRRRLSIEALNVAWPANDEQLRRLFTLRDEHAKLLGYENWPDYDVEPKMIREGRAIGEFIDKIATAARERALADKQVVLDRLRRDEREAGRPEDELSTDIDGADLGYYSELHRREELAVDAQQVRRYFDFAQVRQGLLDVTGRLFGLEWSPAEDAVVWHEDVTAYDVSMEGERLGRIYLDLHPRDGKYKHAAQFDLVRGVAGVQEPEGVLVCNFPRGLMEHSDVVTLFHEFGHLIHHTLAGRGDWIRFSGVATEWDFVEAPSQMLEEWAWDPAVLATFAKDAEGNVIPAELVEKMREADDFGKGYFACTQMFYASVSLDFHSRIVPVEAPQEALTERMVELQRTYSVFSPIPDTHFHCAFGHLEGYSSGYYTYMWSLVIAKDMFSAFDGSDLFDPEVARRYRDKVLARGGSRDAADLVESFLGRPYTFEAYAAWLAR